MTRKSKQKIGRSVWMKNARPTPEVLSEIKANRAAKQDSHGENLSVKTNIILKKSNKAKLKATRVEEEVHELDHYDHITKALVRPVYLMEDEGKSKGWHLDNQTGGPLEED